MKMWQPRPAQWIVIWASVLTASHLWVGLRLYDLLPNSSRAWGLAAYLGPALGNHKEQTRLAVVVLGLAALLLWQTASTDLAAVKRKAATFLFSRTMIAAFAAALLLAILWVAVRSKEPPPESKSPISTAEFLSGESAAPTSTDKAYDVFQITPEDFLKKSAASASTDKSYTPPPSFVPDPQ